MPADPFFARFFPQGGGARKAYHRAIAAYLPESGAVLDLGCGDHRELARYRTPKREVWGADFEPHPRLENARWFRPLAPDGAIPFPTETFDLVASTWVLEHLEQPAQFLPEVRRVLRPGGWFVALTPNAAHYVTWLSRAVALLPHALTQRLIARLYGRAPRDTFRTYYRLNTPRALRSAAHAAGLRLAELAQFANPDYFAFWEPLRRCAILADWFLDRVEPGLGRLYLVASMHKPAGYQPLRAEQAAA